MRLSTEATLRLSSALVLMMSAASAQAQAPSAAGAQAPAEAPAPAQAQPPEQAQPPAQGPGRMAQAGCEDAPVHAVLQEALRASVAPAGGPSNGGLDLHMWGTVVNRAGEVCAVVFSGDGPGEQWPGSRVISAQKANTANAFSLPGLALSTANLYTPTQPGGSLYGLQHSNPVDMDVAYRGRFSAYGSPHDPMTGGKVGGVNVFGGGLPLYTADGTLVGALGVSGDTSCADHNVAWRVRDRLQLANVPGGVGPNGKDGIIYGDSPFAHVGCGNDEQTVAQEIGAGG